MKRGDPPLIEIVDGMSKTKHRWWRSDCGYDPDHYCEHCRAGRFNNPTEYCEDHAALVLANQQKADGTHAPTNEALGLVRTVLNGEQWKLLGLDRVAPFRKIDYIKV